MQQQQNIHPVRIKGVAQAIDRRRRPVQPDHIRIGDDERIRPQQGQRVLHAAAGFQQIRLRRQGHVGHIFEMRGDLIAQIVAVDDEIGDPPRAQPVEGPIDQRAAQHRDQRFRRRIGQRAHAVAHPGRQDHGGFNRGRLNRGGRFFLGHNRTFPHLRSLDKWGGSRMRSTS